MVFHTEQLQFNDSEHKDVVFLSAIAECYVGAEVTLHK